MKCVRGLPAHAYNETELDVLRNDLQFRNAFFRYAYETCRIMCGEFCFELPVFCLVLIFL